jgi:hypothetical protein
MLNAGSRGHAVRRIRTGRKNVAATQSMEHRRSRTILAGPSTVLRVSGFDPLRFVRIMQANRLEMAQPAIHSPHGLSHAITRHRPCPPPWRDPDGVTVLPVVGRLTNFVEIMAPVFSRQAWREFYSYLDPANQSGWGYDYIPLGREFDLASFMQAVLRV